MFNLSILSGVLSWFEGNPSMPRSARVLAIAATHTLLFALAYVLSFLVRFDLTIPDDWVATVWYGLPFILGIKLVTFGAFRMYQGWWRYVSLYDVLAFAQALFVAELLFLGSNVFIGTLDPPRSIYFIDFGISLLLVGGARGSLRLIREAARNRAPSSPDRQNTLILGAGDTGETLSREINKNANLPFRVVGFLDDDPRKQGLKIHNLTVMGRIDDLPQLSEHHNITSALIAMPSANREQLRRVIRIARDARVETRILPALENMLSSEPTKALRDVSISDLLGRAPVRLDVGSIAKFIQGRRVLVTGAGGSIGSELCRQVLRFEPSELIMVERAETPLFQINRELRAQHEEKLVPYVASISDRDRMHEIFQEHHPDVILHAAAYKHVPLMEANPCEAVKNNVAGTQVVAELATEYGVDTFVLISTDKAVNPTSVMGATKRITELFIIKQQQREGNETRFCAVRFGNVLGSNGSVVPIFREQIRKGGPVTVTHPEMTRYFMTIPEAAQLVLQAGALGRGGEIFLLDMGESVKIADLARDLIRLSGLSQDDIEIIYTGIRPGEKLFEELAINEDDFDKTKHNKIFVAKNETQGIELFEEHYQELLETAQREEKPAIRGLLQTIIPTYRPSTPTKDNVIPLRKKHTSQRVG